MRCLSFQCDAQSVGTAAQRDAHVVRLCERVKHEAGQGEGLDLVLLPELSTIAYSEANFARLDTLAEGLDGPSVEHFAQLARDLGACVVFGM
ncbi:MAG: nitrilase-related carbon-nitrogen hydrolase, partial [Pseudomonadota bacterium]